MAEASQSEMSPNFRIFKTHNITISSIDMLLLQLNRHQKSRTRPIGCADSHRAIHLDIQHMAEASQTEMSQFSHFQNRQYHYFLHRDAPTTVNQTQGIAY